MVSSDAKVEGPESVALVSLAGASTTLFELVSLAGASTTLFELVSLAGASTTLFEAVLSVSIARLKCAVINCSAFNGVSMDAWFCAVWSATCIWSNCNVCVFWTIAIVYPTSVSFVTYIVSQDSVWITISLIWPRLPLEIAKLHHYEFRLDHLKNVK